MSQKFELTRRKAFGATASIGIGAALTGAGTFAAFSDSESNGDNNDLTTGTLDLKAGQGDEGSLDLSAGNMAPGDSGTNSVTLNNAGTLPGYLSVALDSITNDEGDTTNDAARLTDALQIQLWLEPTDNSNGTDESVDGNSTEALLTSGNGAQDAGSNSDPGKVTADEYYDSAASDPSSQNYDNVVELVSSGNAEPGASDPTFASYDLVLTWKLPEDAADLNDVDDINDVQGDTATFNFTFDIEGSTNDSSTDTTI